MKTNRLRLVSGALVCALFLCLGLGAPGGPQPAPCATPADNYGCYEPLGKPPCSLLGWLYQNDWEAGWMCTGNTPSDYVCVSYLTGNCCSISGNSGCPPASCPCTY